MITDVLMAIAGLAAMLFVVMLLRAAYMPTRQIGRAEAAGLPAVDAEGASSRLAGAIRFRTINDGSDDGGNSAELDRLHEHLRSSYPNVFKRAAVSVHGGHSLLIEIKGSDPDAEPALFMGHLDVVPIEGTTAHLWERPPFSGDIHMGYVWGRGALDCKHVVSGLLEAAETLLVNGFEPKRGIVFAFGQDEENGGAKGAASIGAYLREKGSRFWIVLDEGGKIDSPGHLTGSKEEAVVSIGEKGFASFRLEVDMPGGHSARPPRDNAINVLVRAVANVNSHSFSPRMDGPLSELLSFAGTELGFWRRFAVANMWLLKPLVVGWLSSDPSTRCIIRTTAVATILNAGVKDNVIPSPAEAVVNTRPAFGETPESVKAELERAIGDERVKVVPIGHQQAPSKVARVDNAQFGLLHSAIKRHFPDAVVIPGLLTGGTDTKHYAGLTDSVYRFIPIKLTHELAEGVHGINERIPVEGYVKMISFYMDIIESTANRI
ncbi:MAG TPA: M20/M25/M40 family metallo-hydrolase [Bacillota bacterium]|nr:M20/M25/M40 family metallo-hydrolase [Bacillota bacterium]